MSTMIKIGQVIKNRYRVDEFIGSGSMSVVYRVWDLKRNTPLAMKILQSELADDPSMFKYFKRGANALKKLARSLGLEFGWHYLLDLAWIIQNLGDVQGKRLIDAGAGTGVLQWYLALEGAEVLSVDRGSRRDLPLRFRRRFKWLRPSLFADALVEDLRADAKSLMNVLEVAGPWDAARDAKLHALAELVTKKHPNAKMLIFSQFADTVEFLEAQLRSRGVTALAGVTGDTDDPTAVAHRFSPVSNEKRDAVSPANELRIVLATDVLSEGQNLQDCAIIVNYDLPWAIIRLIQRAGRVDRIGQKSDTILCYSFLPADGVERIIRLRSRVRQRLRENAEVVGTDEAFFDDDDKTDLPLSVKLGSGYTNPANLIERLADAGAKGVVLFNRWQERRIRQRIDAAFASGGDRPQARDPRVEVDPSRPGA